MLYSTDNMGGDEFEPADSIRPIGMVPKYKSTMADKCCEDCELSPEELKAGKMPRCLAWDCQCHKEPEAGWESATEINTLATKLQNDTYSRSEIARRLHLLIDKAREEVEEKYYQPNKTVSLTKEFKRGQLQALSRIEEEAQKYHPSHLFEGGGRCEACAIIDAITKLREEV